MAMTSARYRGYDDITSVKVNTCDQYKKQADIKYSMVPRVWSSLNSYERDDVTLVGDLEINDIEWLNLVIRNWSGSLSVTVYIDVKDEGHLAILRQLHMEYPVLMNRVNLDIHLVAKAGVSIVSHCSLNMGWGSQLD